MDATALKRQERRTRSEQASARRSAKRIFSEPWIMVGIRPKNRNPFTRRPWPWWTSFWKLMKSGVFPSPQPEGLRQNPRDAGTAHQAAALHQHGPRPGQPGQADARLSRLRGQRLYRPETRGDGQRSSEPRARTAPYRENPAARRQIWQGCGVQGQDLGQVSDARPMGGRQRD